MTTVGQQLLAAETGMTRYDTNVDTVSTTGVKFTGQSASYYNNTLVQGGGSAPNDVKDFYMRFNFTGTKLVLIGYQVAAYPTTFSLKIDGVAQTITPTANISQCVFFTSSSLSNTEHCVEIYQYAESASTQFDAIDIDSTGTLKPYNENITPTTQAYSYII